MQPGHDQVGRCVGQGQQFVGGWTRSSWARRRASFSSHSAIARRASTATTATPMAQPIALARPTTLAVVVQPSTHDTSVTANPMSPPQSPPMRIDTVARTRASSGGAEVGAGPVGDERGEEATAVSLPTRRRGGRCGAPPPSRAGRVPGGAVPGGTSDI